MTSRERQSEAGYRDFWADTGRDFPDLAPARSTRQYRADEEWLLRRALPTLAGRRVFKTDLWDEAKNTRILRWAAGQGAEVYGIDISPPIVRGALGEFAQRRRLLRASVGDVRRLPFADGSFDAIYSMGTVEHFDDTEGAVAELFRVLKPGGRLILGVPNRHDPFLRPLVVALLYRLGLYGYGYEKSYSRRGLRRLLEGAGFDVVDEQGILFVPGYLRMVDLACAAWARPLALLSGALVAPFDLASRRWPRLRRHGYLIASVADRPA